VSYRSVVLADSPVLFLPLGEPSGNFVDLSSSGLTGVPNGTLTRATSTGFAGVGSGVTFAALNTTYVSVADTPILDITGDFTYECWMIFQTNGTTQYIMSKGQDAGGATAGYGFYLTTAAALVVDQVNITAGFRPGVGQSSGTWHYLAVTRIGNAWAMYVDNTQVATNPAIALPCNATARDFLIGATYTSGGAGQFPCNATTSIASAAVYSTGLSQAQLLVHYNARNDAGGSGSPRKSPPTPFVATIAANLPPGLGGTPPGLGGEPPGQAKKQSPQSPAARRRHLFGGDPRRKRR
jgi:hypothetical protein